MDIVELRSDTFTRPTPEMRRAMADAEVGDDCWGEDPTANALQQECAELLGKEAALFVPTGTMGNEVSIKAMTTPSDEIIAEERSHVVNYELGGPAYLSGVTIRTFAAPSGVPDPDDVVALFRTPGGLAGPTSLVCVENTHNGRGGRVVPIDAMRAIAKVAHERGAKVFLDGARIFNAAVALGVPAREIAAHADALSFCFSKGLGAPIGSMIVGTKEHVTRARRYRRLFGAGMRQVGVLCAAARVALHIGIDRLAEDHANAKRLAEGFAGALPGCVDPRAVETNIMFVTVRDAGAVVEAMAKDGVRVGDIGPDSFRAVTSREVDAAGIERAITAFANAVR